jgi:hypothetical protein
MSTPQYFSSNEPFVVSELIDGEVVIMNLKSGNYYSARKTGALLWEWLRSGLTVAAMSARLAEIYGGDESAYAADLAAFVDCLLSEGLIKPTAAPAVRSTPPGEATQPPKTYQAPLLEVYADMQDLLLLDPIHDTDDVGWPVAKATPAPVN